MSNTPSDAEIDEVTLDVLGYAALDKETNETARMIARAVLAKWGTPQPAPACHHRPPCAECASLTAQGGKV